MEKEKHFWEMWPGFIPKTLPQTKQPAPLPSSSSTSHSSMALPQPTINFMDQFTLSYIRTALWSTTTDVVDNDGNEKNISLDQKYKIQDIDTDTIKKMRDNCKRFQEENSELLHQLELTDEKAGYYFWLSHNGHGSNFGDLASEVADGLDEAAEAYPQIDLYVGDDGKIYS